MTAKKKNSYSRDQYGFVIRSMQRIDQDLRAFQQNVTPLMERIGVDLQAWTFTLGSDYKRTAQTLYSQIQQRYEAQGIYSDQDLKDLAVADKLNRKGKRLENLAPAIQTTGRLITTGWSLWKEANARDQLRLLIEKEKKELPQLKAALYEAKRSLESCLADENEFFLDTARQIPASRSHRRELIDRLNKSMDAFRELGELRGQIAYFDGIIAAVETFDPLLIDASKQRLVKAGVDDLPQCQLLGMRYLDDIDHQIQKLSWDKAYYRSGLPAGLLYFLGPGWKKLPAGARLQSVDQAITSLRKETPSLNRPGEVFQALKYFIQEIGILGAIFGFQFKVFQTLPVLFLLGLLAAVSLLAGPGQELLGKFRWWALDMVSISNPGQFFAFVFILSLLACVVVFALLIFRKTG